MVIVNMSINDDFYVRSIPTYFHVVGLFFGIWGRNFHCTIEYRQLLQMDRR